MTPRASGHPRAGRRALRLILVRHGETLYNREGRVQGQSQEPLTELGRQQAGAVAHVLAQERLAAVYSSPLPRAAETATAIAEQHHLPVLFLDGLKELDMGELDGLTIQEMRQRYPTFLAAWTKEAGTVTIPGGETLGALQERAWSAVQGVLGRHSGQTVVAVSHNFTIFVLALTALGLSLPLFRRLRMDLGGYTILQLWAGRPGVIEVFNEVCHLRELGAVAK